MENAHSIIHPFDSTNNSLNCLFCVGLFQVLGRMLRTESISFLMELMSWGARQTHQTRSRQMTLNGKTDQLGRK